MSQSKFIVKKFTFIVFWTPHNPNPHVAHMAEKLYKANWQNQKEQILIVIYFENLATKNLISICRSVVYLANWAEKKIGTHVGCMQLLLTNKRGPYF